MLASRSIILILLLQLLLDHREDCNILRRRVHEVYFDKLWRYTAMDIRLVHHSSVPSTYCLPEFGSALVPMASSMRLYSIGSVRAPLRAEEPRKEVSD